MQRKQYMQKKKFVSPLVLGSVEVQMESPILAVSITAVTGTLETTGHEVRNYDFSDETEFNHTWE